MTQDTFNTYSCRFEYPADYTKFIIAANNSSVDIVTHALELFKSEGGEVVGPDTYVEFVSDVGIEKLRGVLRGVIDMHVPIQTLKQAAMKDNRMERDYDII